MSITAKLRKVRDDLYEEDFKRDDGTLTAFKWERQFERLHLTLTNIKCSYGASVEIKELSLFGNGTDEVRQHPQITAEGHFEGDTLNLLGTTNKIRRNAIRRVTLQTYTGDWEKLVGEARTKEALDGSHRWFGELTYHMAEDEEKQYVEFGDGEQFLLLLVVPSMVFDRVFELIKSNNPTATKVSLGARVGVFRSEVDRNLEEWHHPKDYWVEDTSAAIFNSVRVEYAPIISAAESESVAASLGGEIFANLPRAIKGPKKDLAVVWMSRVFYAVVVLTIVALFRR